MLLLIPLLPLAAAFILCLPFSFIKEKAGLFSAVSVFSSLILILILINTKDKIELTWFTTSSYSLSLSLLIDGLEWYVSLITAVIGLVVIIYSIKSIETRKEYYFRVISFFVGSMFLLVLSDSFILTFISWEFVGLSSFLLIGFHYQETDAKEASRKAFLMTRIGDFGFLLALLLILINYRTTDISSFLGIIKNPSNNTYIDFNLLSILFLAAAIGKSAQLPFSSWLPDAMAGPSPVSALIHSATMVAAGVFLILKLFPLFEASILTLNIILCIGMITALTAALVATAKYNIKRILAWSTISQLGEMYFILGLGRAMAASFHLAAHAVFKAGLFLAAGIISHSSSTKDIRNMGNLKKHQPYTLIIFVLCGLALSGFPPFAGFWSEDEILGATLKYNSLYSAFMILLIFLAGIYISRAGFAIFGDWKGNKNPKVKEGGKVLIYSTGLLAILALVIGVILKLNIEDILHFSSLGETNWGWRAAAIAASGGGLIFGMWRTKNYGPVPALGNIFSYFDKIADVFVIVPVKLIRNLSFLVNKIENLFDEGAKDISLFILSAASIGNKSEVIFDKGAQNIKSVIVKSAYETDYFELKGFSQKLNQFAYSFGIAGSQLRKLETGKIFLYTIFLFSWIIVTALAVGILFMF